MQAILGIPYLKKKALFPGLTLRELKAFLNVESLSFRQIPPTSEVKCVFVFCPSGWWKRYKQDSVLESKSHEERCRDSGGQRTSRYCIY